jgi:hypothetical protein
VEVGDRPGRNERPLLRQRWGVISSVSVYTYKGYNNTWEVELEFFIKENSDSPSNYIFPFIDDGRLPRGAGGEPAAFLQIFVDICMRSNGNVEQKGDALFQMSNGNGVVFAYCNTVEHVDDDTHAAGADRVRKGPVPRPVEQPMARDPGRTAARQTAAFLHEP